jgi:two-component system, NtrC family, sensor histidine kinase HydH
MNERRRDGMLRATDDPPCAMPAPPGFDEIQRRELSRLFGRMVGIRLVVIPLALALVLVLALFDPARWRAPFLVAAVVPIGAYFIAEAVRFRRRGFRPAAIVPNLLGALAGQVALCAATGALESPVTYAFVPLAFLVGVFGGRAHWPIIAAQVAAVWGLAAAELTAALPDLNLAAFGGGARAGHTTVHLLTTAAVLSAVLLLGSRVGLAVRRGFDRMLAGALRAQADALRAHAERAEELTALTAEIAHELKNPLASVKGLAKLVADGAAPARTAERLAVLRREVDRMQDILDEFLNFSRPLVPLALGRVDLAALAREVASLHEGLAQERGLALAVRAAPADARCDRRKVKQVLINLVQNALDASRPGAAVEIEVGAAGAGEARVAVLDRGPGLAPGVAARAFEAGVTSKERGSGLGLTIARALARQHGGEVELTPRDGGGCAAVLRLPAAARPGVTP